MNRALWKKHLEIAKRHVAEGRRVVIRQRQIVVELQKDGHNTTTAEALLEQFEATLEAHIADRDRLNADLSR